MTFCKTILVVVGMIGYTLTLEVTMKLDDSVVVKYPDFPRSGFALSKENYEVLPLTIGSSDNTEVGVLGIIGNDDKVMAAKEFYLAKNGEQAETEMVKIPIIVSDEIEAQNGIRVRHGKTNGVNFGTTKLPYDEIDPTVIVEALKKGNTVVEYFKYEARVATLFHRTLEGIKADGNRTLATTTDLERIPIGSAVLCFETEGGVTSFLGVVGFAIAGNKIMV